MEIKQIYNIINDAAEQSLGMKDLKPNDATFVSIGEKVFENENNTDVWYKALIDRIGRTVIAIRPYIPSDRTMKREPFEFGAALQKISYQMPQAQENPTWYPLSKDAAPLNKKYPLTIRQTLFSKLSTWEVGGTVPDVQLRTAFLSAKNMAAFIDGIFINMQNSLAVDYENASNIARASYVAALLNSAKETVKINLLTNYNAATNNTLTVGTALMNADFLRYAAQQIKLVSDRMVRMSTTFNAANWQRHTPKDKQVIEILSDFTSSFDTYLQSDVFHNELTKLPLYESVPYWQGSGTDWGFDSVSGINLTIEIEGATESDPNTTATVTQSGIVAVIRDYDSIGITIDNRRTKSFYDPHNEFTNYWEKADIGYFRDQSENGVVFYLAET